jgi:DNA-directed RNA polymerase sigma subunit (sigma70/sigma32)
MTDIERIDVREAVARAGESMNPRLLKVLTLAYGLNGDGVMTDTEIARAWGVSRERIRQLRTKAIRVLRGKFARGNFV